MSTLTPGAPVLSVREARTALEDLYVRLRAAGCAAPSQARGQLIRPLLSLAGARALGIPEDARFWSAAAAVQLAHEASLVHDDVIDRASHRRGEPTLSAARGVAAALVEGDHLLTTAYRLAATAAEPAFVASFAHAVERTVAGEKMQGSAAGMMLDERGYRAIVAGKSGELLGCALAAAPLVHNDARARHLYALGRSIGTLYQMLDDLLDYCPSVDSGKPALGDFRQRRWTWPLLEMPDATWDDDAENIATHFATRDDHGTSPIRRCLQRLQSEASGLVTKLALHMPTDTLVREILSSWLQRAEEAVATVEAAACAAAAAHAAAQAAAYAAAEEQRVRRLLESRLPEAAALHRFFAHNSRSFSFAARLFPRDLRDRVAGVYAFCRATDDIADGDLPVEDRMRCLDMWEMLARRAYDGDTVGLPIVETVMRDAARSGVPFTYIAELVEGMRMDLRGDAYQSLNDLRVYSYRVAGVIGQWLTRLCGIHDGAVLERAAALGHAMQLTNIIRDAGDDLRSGRIYLPAHVMQACGVTTGDLREFGRGAPRTVAYTELIETLMRHAESDYDYALEAVPLLPSYFGRAVLVAAYVYRGIHDAVRAANYDNIHARAVTGTPTKIYLAARALLPAPRFQPRPRQAAAHPVRSALTMMLIAVAASATLPLQAQSSTELSLRAVAAGAVAAQPGDAAARLDLVRATFFVAVGDEHAVADGHAAVAEVVRASAELAHARRALLLAYTGAFTALEAKHGRWPPSRLRAVRRGLAQLDSAVALAPADAEVRYLRLVNSFYLPGLFGRKEAVRTDMAALVALLHGTRAQYPSAMFTTMAAFVLQHGALTPDAARRLRSEMAQEGE